MPNVDENSKPLIQREIVSARYPADRIRLLDAIQVRWGMRHRAEVIEAALNRLLEEEGLLNAA